MSSAPTDTQVDFKTNDPGSCPACAAPAALAFSARDYNHRRSRRAFHYARCSRCRVIFLVDPPDDLACYDPDDYFQFPTRARLAEMGRKDRHQVAMLKEWVPGGCMIEVGPAQGTFALQASEAGFDVTTIEMDARCCRYLESVVGVIAIHSDQPENTLPKLPPSDAIVMWQVIEHLGDPWRCLEAAAANLRRDGILLIATPNPESLGLRALGRFWPHIDAPRHLTLIPIDVLTARLNALGLQRVALWTDDPSAREWNRFAWQRVLMNCSPHRPAQVVLSVLGKAVTGVLAPFERRGRHASSYTAVFRQAAP